MANVEANRKDLYIKELVVALCLIFSLSPPQQILEEIGARGDSPEDVWHDAQVN